MKLPGIAMELEESWGHAYQRSEGILAAVEGETMNESKEGEYEGEIELDCAW